MAFNTATDKAAKLTVNLKGLIDSKVTALLAVRKREKAISEAKFQQLVIDSGMSYDSQLEYRKKQIDEEKKKDNPDKDYITELNSSVTDLRKLNKYKKINSDYLDSYNNLKDGKISLEQHLGLLRDQYNEAPDEAGKAEILSEMSKVRTQIAEAEINTLKNRVSLAEKDGTVSTLNNAIQSVLTRKSFADLSGNTEESSAWDVTLASLRKQLNETNINNSIHDIDFNLSRKGGTSTSKIDLLNDEISKADTATKVTINGTVYNSAKEYWESKRNNYIAGIGDDKNFSSFFNDFETEVKNKIDTVSKINTYGFVPVTTIQSIGDTYNSLASKPEFTNYKDKLNTSKISALSYGVDKSASALITSSVETLNLDSGIKALESLESKFGIDLSSNKADLNSKIISKGSQLPSIKQATDVLRDVGATTPSEEVPEKLTPEAIIKQNNQVPEGQIFNKKEEVPVTTKVIPPASAASDVVPKKEEVQYNEIDINPGDTLSVLATKYKTTTDNLKTINNIVDKNRIVAGNKLKVPVI